MSNRRKSLNLAGSRAAADSTTVAASTDLIPSTVCEDFAHFSIQLSGTWVGTVQWQGSNDGANWVALRATNFADATAVLGASSAVGIFRGMLGCRYFRAAVTAYTSGTVVATVLLHPEAIPSMVKST